MITKNNEYLPKCARTTVWIMKCQNNYFGHPHWGHSSFSLDHIKYFLNHTLISQII